MVETTTHTLPYQKEPTRIFNFIRKLPWAQLLDSGKYLNEKSRYDIMVADPVFKILSDKGTTTVTNHHDQFIEQNKDLFVILNQYLEKPTKNNTEFPFYAGAVGYFGYDHLNTTITQKRRPSKNSLPDCAIGIYHWSIVTDHQNRTTTFISLGKNHFDLSTLIHQLQSENTQSENTQKPLCTTKLSVDCDFKRYEKNFKKIQNYLIAGDCYQINYARCFSATVQGNAWESYKQLRTDNPTPFGAYLNFPFGEILCSSPERFLKISGKTVESRPIKGTRPRSINPIEDKQLKKSLMNSDKDKAENLMIVDLLRNDLSKSCQLGSIKVPELFTIESYPTVYHLVSRITGKIKNNKNSLDVLRDCFPGGSITGAPKKRAMEIIEEIEPYQRGLYCGAIGYINFDGSMDTNIAIRSLVVDKNHLNFWVGGGIVADSDLQQEFQETLDKGRAFFNLLQQSP